MTALRIDSFTKTGGMPLPWTYFPVDGIDQFIASYYGKSKAHQYGQDKIASDLFSFPSVSHVYASSITAGASRTGAMFVTFLLSSLLHELVMAIVSGKIRGYLFAMQMAQIPLIALGQVRTPF